MALYELPKRRYQEERGSKIVIFLLQKERWKEGNLHFLRTYYISPCAYYMPSHTLPHSTMRGFQIQYLSLHGVDSSLFLTVSYRSSLVEEDDLHRK